MVSNLSGAARRRFTPFAVLIGLGGSAVLGLGVTGTFSALTATIVNSTNTAGAGSIVMQETDSSGTTTNACSSSGAGSSNNSYTCSTFNKYGGNLGMIPGQAVPYTVRIYNTGSIAPTTFNLTPAACLLTNTPNNSGNICGSLLVTLTCTPYSGGTAGTPVTVYTGQTLTAINTAGVKSLAGCVPGTSTVGSATYSKMDFSVQLDPNAGNSIQGESASQQLTWQFSS